MNDTRRPIARRASGCLGFACTVAASSGALALDVADVQQPGVGEYAPGASRFQLRRGFPVIFTDSNDEALDWLGLTDSNKRYALRWGLEVLPADYSSFTQDSASVRQVGLQSDQWTVRSFKVTARGFFELGRHWDYVANYEYKSFDQSTAANWQPSDLNIATDTFLGRVTIGKQKEPFVYEMVGDTRSLTQNERFLDPFLKSRSIGVKFLNTYGGGFGTWSIGVFNDWLASGQSYATNGRDVVGRITAVPLWEDSGDTYLHLALSARDVGASGSTLRLRGRPASDAATYYVDTGKIDGDHALNGALELLWNVGPYSLLGEYAHSEVSVRSGANPDFSGYYAIASWVVTGEHRPYNKKIGYAGRVTPAHDFGAWEVYVRYGVDDLNATGVQGGRMKGFWAGVNWWATRQWMASAGYGNIDLDRSGSTGNTQTVLTRLQWVF